MFLRLLDRLIARVRRRDLDREVRDELAFHLEMQTQANVARGMMPEEAQREARIALGGVEQAREAVRDERALWVEPIWRDLRYAVRTLRRNPAFAAVAILTLGLGVGVNTAVFSIVNAVLLRPLPVRAPGELRFVRASHTDPRVAASVTYRSLPYLREGNNAFTGMLARAEDQATLRAGFEALPATGEQVTGNYFEVLGVEPVVGRALVAADDRTGAPPTAVISDDLWRGWFHADPAILGRTLELDAQWGTNTLGRTRGYTIVGVMGPDFPGTLGPWRRTQYWVPQAARAADWNAMEPGFADEFGVLVIGRLKPGVSDGAARAVVEVRGRQIHQAFYAGGFPGSFSLTLVDSYQAALASSRVLPFDPFGHTAPSRLAAGFLLVTGIVLLIAITNLAGVMLARVVVRRGENTLRVALGASRVRVAQQMIAEAMVLSILGSAVGLLAARGLVSAFAAALPARFGAWETVPLSLDIPLDFRVLAFTALTSIAAGLLVGLLPAIQSSRVGLLATISGRATAAPGRVRSRLQYGVVIPQVALSLVLLIIAGGFLQVLARTETADRGYDVSGVAIGQFAVVVPAPPASTAHQILAERRAGEQGKLEERRVFEQRVLERVKAWPDVTDAALSASTPFAPVTSWVAAETGFPGRPSLEVSRVSVSPGYLETLRIQLRVGRSFDARDTSSGPQVAIVSAALADALWPHGNPIGQHLAFAAGPQTRRGRGGAAPPRPPAWMEVVGVVKDVLPALSDAKQRGAVYILLAQQQQEAANYVMARGNATTARLNREMQTAVGQASTDAAVVRSTSLAELVNAALYPQRAATTLVAVSGLVALLLATLGLYGLIAYSAAQRKGEVAVRRVLGASDRDVMTLVLKDAVKIALAGTGLGLPLAYATTRIASSLVPGIPTLSSLGLMVTPLCLAAVILAACLVPARRAMRVDPMETLRSL